MDHQHSNYYDAFLDARMLNCPQPLRATKKELSKLDRFSVLKVVVTDPSFEIDCGVFTRQAGHLLLESWKEGEDLYFLIQKLGKESSCLK